MEVEMAPVVGPYRRITLEGVFVEDFFLDWVGYPPHWTKDPLPVPCYSSAPVYQGGTRNNSTGEWTGGSWFDACIPSEEEVATHEFKSKQAHLTSVIQEVLDTFAKTGGYDSVLSLCTYATSSVPKFRVEGQYGVDVRDQCWMTGYAILGEIAAGARGWPTDDEARAMMPPLAWPSLDLQP